VTCVTHQGFVGRPVSFGSAAHPIVERFRTFSMQKLSCLFAFALAFSIITSLVACTTTQAAPSAPIPAAKLDAPLAAAPGKQTAVFAGGCFWGTQSVFEAGGPGNGKSNLGAPFYDSRQRIVGRGFS
jgi:hypothetical protein